MDVTAINNARSQQNAVGQMEGQGQRRGEGERRREKKGEEVRGNRRKGEGYKLLKIAKAAEGGGSRYVEHDDMEPEDIGCIVPGDVPHPVRKPPRHAKPGEDIGVELLLPQVHNLVAEEAPLVRCGSR